MKLRIKNIAKVRNAEIELNGITVIAGENDTGKSTISKSLYSVFNSFYNIDNQIKNERRLSLYNILTSLYYEYTDGLFDEDTIIKTLFEMFTSKTYDINTIKKEILEDLMHVESVDSDNLDDNDLTEAASRIKEIFDISDEEIFKNVILKFLNAEFNYQINNIYCDEPGRIELDIKNNSTTITVIDNSVKEISNVYKLKTEVVYIDDPFVVDELGSMLWSNRARNPLGHRIHLRKKLQDNIHTSTNVDEIIANNKLEKIYSRIDSVFDGEIISGKRNGWQFRKNGSDRTLNIKNISTGLKTFVILKKLLEKGILNYNGTIILDEPEIHLHPQWQLLFAELIVLIQKEFNMHILINTHSPYFMQAIEVYSAKYEIADKCKYYLAQNDGDTSNIKDVTESPEDIYRLLARPLQELENTRYEND